MQLRKNPNMCMASNLQRINVFSASIECLAIHIAKSLFLILNLWVLLEVSSSMSSSFGLTKTFPGWKYTASKRCAQANLGAQEKYQTAAVLLQLLFLT